MKIINKTMKSLFVVFFIATSAAFAQENVSDTELKQFAEAFTAIQEVNQRAQTEMINVVEQAGFDLVRFNELFEASQNPNLETTAATPEETKKFESVLARMEAMQGVFQKQMEDAVAKKGITVERFEQVGNALENDTVLQQRFQAMMEQ